MRDGLDNIQRVAVIGGDSDIGVAIAANLVRDLGVSEVILAGRNQGAMASRSSELGVAPVTVHFDAVDTDGHAATVDAVFANGDIDVVILAFGSLLEERGLATNIAQAMDMATVNYLGTYSVTLRFAKRLSEQAHGHLVALSSFAVARARPDNYLYGSTKAGADFLWSGVRDELALSGVGMTIVRPGFVKTKMTAGLPSAPFSVSPHKVATQVTEAIRRSESGIVWVPGFLGVIALAMKLLPVGLLRRLAHPTASE